MKQTAIVCLGWVAGVLTIVFGVLWLGTLVHEMGHASVAIASGAQVTQLNVLGMDLYPTLCINYRPGYFGYVSFDRPLPYPQVEYISAAGSLSTLMVALLAQVILWIAPLRRVWPRLVTVGFCFSWIDILYHTWPVLMGSQNTARAEAYLALTELGAPGWLIGGAVVGVSALLLILTLAAVAARWMRREKLGPAALQLE